MGQKSKESDSKTLEKQDAEDKKNEASEKLKAASAGGTPCDTCLAKCNTKVCRTWCNANWCEGMRATGNKKEIVKKLRKAKIEQQEAAAAMATTKKQLDADVRAERTAAAHAKGALTKAAESGDDKDVKEAQ